MLVVVVDGCQAGEKLCNESDGGLDEVVWWIETSVSFEPHQPKYSNARAIVSTEVRCQAFAIYVHFLRSCSFT